MSGAPFCKPWGAQRVDFERPGFDLGSILGGLGALAGSWGFPVLQGRPGSIFAAILGAKWEAKGAQMPVKIDLKMYEISSAFFDGILIAKWREK